MKAPLHSLPEVHSSVATGHRSAWRRLFAFLGPAWLVSVGYMDPGNWATDLEGGARFGYSLLWVLVLSNAMAILLQTLSARLGIVSRQDLAQACRDEYPPLVSRSLWVLCEIGMVACDLAEVLGAAVALQLLFELPLPVGVMVTAADTLIVLWLNQYRIRTLESVVVRLVAIVAACVGMEIFLVKPDAVQIAGGLRPQLDGDSLFAAVAILGATVMPHNLFLHSSLAQTRRIGTDLRAIRAACRYNLWDTLIALNGAMFINIGILVLAAATFWQRQIAVTDIGQAAQMLGSVLGGKMAAVAFAIALLCVGQASTLTGAMAGQIVMEGFLNIRLRPWLRRLITRALALIPAVITASLAGESGVYQLLLISQMALCIQLPFAVVPLVRFTGDRERMGEFATRRPLKILAWGVAGVVIVLDVWLGSARLQEWIARVGGSFVWVRFLLPPVAAVLGGLLLYAIAGPRSPSRAQREGRRSPEVAGVEDLATDSPRHSIEERFDIFMRHLQGIAFVKDPAGKYIYFNDSGGLAGVEATEILGKTDEQIWPPEFAAAYEWGDQTALAEGRTLQTVERFPRAEGTGSWLMYRFPILDRKTQQTFLGGVALDISGRAQVEEQLRILAAQRHESREVERAKTSRNLDDISQTLAGLDLQLSTAAQHLAQGGNPVEVVARLDALSKMLSSTIEVSSRLAADLRPSLVENVGLAAAVEWYGREFGKRSGICVIIQKVEDCRMTADRAMAAFRIFQEMSAFLERRVRMSAVLVSLSPHNDVLVLAVRASGARLTVVADPEPVELLGIRELALAMGAELAVQAPPGQELGLELRIPLEMPQIQVA